MKKPASARKGRKISLTSVDSAVSTILPADAAMIVTPEGDVVLALPKNPDGSERVPMNGLLVSAIALMLSETPEVIETAIDNLYDQVIENREQQKRDLERDPT